MRHELRRETPSGVRPGRFDHVVPVGPPDEDARAAIWRRCAAEISDEEVDVDALVEASPFFTPADIEFAARKAAQSALEREVFEQAETKAGTEEFIDAIRQTRPTLSRELIDEFKGDVERFARH